MRLKPRYARLRGAPRGVQGGRPPGPAPRQIASWPASKRLAAIGIGATMVVAVAGWDFSGRPGTLSTDSVGKAVPLRATDASAPASFSSIILPDLLVVAPRGLSRAEVARLRAIKGVIKLITFDGAQITVSGQPASVIGVDPSKFRSWVPLRTASDKQLWAHLAAGQFIAETSSAARLGLTNAAAYQLAGASSLHVRFGGAARLNVAGVDLVVDQAMSRQLGLVHQVAALISAPGPSIATLTAKVRRVFGADVRLVVLRGRQPAVLPDKRQPVPVTASQITNYLQLFQASSAKYCPSVSWTVLAAIGQIESGDGRNVGPSTAGALGPMQFLPSTWAEWGIDGFGPPGPPDVMNPFDAVPSAARLLCAAGAQTGTEAGLRRAVFAYNHADWYVNEVLALAGEYAAEYR